MPRVTLGAFDSGVTGLLVRLGTQEEFDLGDEVFAGNEQVNLVVKVRDGTHIVDEHCDILLASNGGIVVDQVIVDELVEVLEASLVERVDVVAVDALQVSRHRSS